MRMSRGLLALVIVAGVALRSPAAEDKFLKESRAFSGEDKLALLDALTKNPLDETVDKWKQKIEIAVRYSLYPTTATKTQTTSGLMSRQYYICDRWLRDTFADSKVKNKALVEEFHRRWLAELDLILSNSQQEPVTRVNAARLLDRLADLAAREELADLAVKTLGDEQQVDGARYYAASALKHLLAKLNQQKPAGIQKPERRDAVVVGLVKFVERKLPFTPTTPVEEDGLRFIRREAVRALASVGVPLAGTEGHAALTLALVAGKDKGLALAPRLDESVEAAIGLARMKPDAKAEFQPGYAAYIVGSAVRDMVRDYKPTNKREPWKLHAARLHDALKAMAESYPKDPSVKSVLSASGAALTAIEAGREAVNIDPLKEWLNTPPPQQSIYKSELKTVVDPTPEKSK
jgi:hypothetical protein